MDSDQYKTITTKTKEVLYKDRNSKFYAYAFPIKSEAEVKTHIEEDLRKRHHTARHFCYAYQIGKAQDERNYRANDDGEPSNSAGMPIYGQILSYGLTEVLIVVVRYFGGTKLGVGGLMQAYKTAAELALNNASIVVRSIRKQVQLEFDYPEMNMVMRILKEENITIIENRSQLKCIVLVSVRLKKVDEILQRFKELHKVKLTVV